MCGPATQSLAVCSQKLSNQEAKVYLLSTSSYLRGKKSWDNGSLTVMAMAMILTSPTVSRGQSANSGLNDID